MKGQVFIAGAFMMAVLLVIFSITLGKGITAVETPYEKYVLDNAEVEYAYSLETGNVKIFNDYVMSDDLKAFYVEVRRTDSGFDAIMGNYFDFEVNVRINATNTDPVRFEESVDARTQLIAVFDSSGDSDISIEYTILGKTHNEKIIMLSSDEKKLFYHITLQDSELSITRRNVIDG